MIRAGISTGAATPHAWGLPSLAFAILLALCTTPASGAQWYMIDGRKVECERASHSDYPTPDDYMEYLQKQNQYRSRQVSRDFTGRPQVVTITDTNNRQMVFYADDDSCQQALRRQLRVGGSPQSR